MRPGSIRTAGSTVVKPRAREANEPSPLEGLEQEVEAMRKAVEAEQAEVASLSASLGELFMRNSCEEYLNQLEKRIQVIENRQVEVVHWRIEKAEELRAQHQKGDFVASTEFSAGDDFCEEGYCSLYLHVPMDTTVSRTLFVGRARHGPAEADALKNSGVSEMCVMSNQIDKDTGSLVIGVEGLQVLSSPHLVETRTKIQLLS
ncbi:unnamed protein product [Effrenium voratum]|uniref:Uncharacterized protein n=1 Tax=Effrenium voratum TaxID=2562239 RepID=A0AA36N3T1_9DINO|nr:unnamed protein product [Effrenium voratum]CAJ1416319.1 unnamed protein product [Effrenium voratum]